MKKTSTDRILNTHTGSRHSGLKFIATPLMQ